jgi:integrase
MRVLFATAICSGLRIGELLALRWQEVNLANGTLTVLHAKTAAGQGREIDLWPELREELSIHKATTPHSAPADYVFATSTGNADTRSNIARRLKRAVARANQALAEEEKDTPAIPVELSPHSLRRTFASLLYLRGENPVYVMNQMGHADPKLALRIYTKVMSEQRRRGPGARLLTVLDSSTWTQPEASRENAAGPPATTEPVALS